MKFLKNNKIIILILILASILRLVLLDRIPTGISNDELHFVLNAKSVFQRFTSLSGAKWSPLSFQTIPDEVSSELPFITIAPIVGPLPTNLFTARLPYVIVGVLSIFLIYLITKKLSKNNSVALVSALIAALNPWSIYVNRTSFDAPLALFFFLLTIYLQSCKKQKLILLSFISSVFAFYSYIGTKVIYLPFMLISCFFFWKYFHHKKNTFTFLLISIFSILITANFLFSLKQSVVGKRSSELITPNSPQIIALVETERNQSLNSALKTVLTNRYILYLRTFIDKYLYNFSTDIMFLNGDHTFMVSLWKMGYFYYIDIVLLLLGVIYLFNNYRSIFYFLFSLILLSPIPEAIRADKIPAYAFHSVFQYPFLFIIIGAGTYYFWQLFSSKIVRAIFILIYFILFLNFIDLYFFKYPVYQSEGFSVSRRLISKYLSFEKNISQHIFVITPEPDSLFRNYLFYNNIINTKSIDTVTLQYKLSSDRQTLNWENITFTSIYPTDISEKNTYIIDKNINNYHINDENLQTITNFFDRSEIYRIIYGKTCQQTRFADIPNGLFMKDLNIEYLTNDTFCQKFVSIK
ncbi:MAG: glycosyltransferase family 39 protein [Candidatus Shapirobacteria bacterium]